MKARNILTSVREQQRAIFRMIEQTNYLRYSLYGRAIRYDSDKIQTSAGDMMCAKLVEVCDQDARIQKRQKKLNRRKDQIRTQLNKLSNEDHAQVLDLYYLSCSDAGRLYTWGDVAKIMHKSESHVRGALHAEALDRYNRLLY